MDKNKIAVGLDIGTTKIVAMVARKQIGGETEILGVGKSDSQGVEKGLVLNLIKTTEAIKEAINMAEEVSGMKIKDVVVGVSGKQIRTVRQSDYIMRQDPFKTIDENDLRILENSVRNINLKPSEQIIHILPQEYKVDSESDITDPIGMTGTRLEGTFHIVIGQDSALKNLRKCVEDAGLQLSAVVLEPLVSSIAVLTEEEREGGVILIDFGGGTTDLTIVQNDIVRHTAVIPQGGRLLTSEIKTAVSILERYAEKLKTTFGCAWPGAVEKTKQAIIPALPGIPAKQVSLFSLAEVIHACMDSILDVVKSEIDNYKKHEPFKQIIGSVVLTGGGSGLKGIQTLVQHKLGMPTRIGSPNVHLAEQNKECITDPIYATCVGLTIYALKDMEPYQEEEKPKAKEDTKHKTSDVKQEAETFYNYDFFNESESLSNQTHSNVEKEDEYKTEQTPTKSIKNIIKEAKKKPEKPKGESFLQKIQDVLKKME